MSGRDAVKKLLEDAKREEFLAADLVARALRQDRRRVIRDWRRRELPETRVGRAILFPSAIVLATYFSHAPSGTVD